ncbi:MAG: hypothetical protein ABR529_10120 [Actinomycetota bacterium]
MAKSGFNIGARGEAAMVEAPDPAAIRLEVLSRMLAGREGWTRTGSSWRLGPYELIPRMSPGLPYELWKGKRCVAALMVPRDAIAVCECLALAASTRPPSDQSLFRALAIPAPPPGD